MTRLSTREILTKLVGFDTTSRNPNVPLLEFVEGYLQSYGVASRRVTTSPDGKANLFATIGPDVPGGIVLSGHTDVVPVDGQDWVTDPFVLTEKDGLLYGRGSTDMKGFVAAALAIVPDLVASNRKKPVHLAFSYDEEVGCTGVVELVEDLAARKLAADICIVGEPTEMRVVVGNKSGRAYRCTVKGLEAHSSLTPQGVNAIQVASRLINFISDIGCDMAGGAKDADFDVEHSTISVGMIEGGSGINIVPNHCSFVFEYRLVPQHDADEIFQRIVFMAEKQILPAMRAVYPESDIRFEQVFDYPAHQIDHDHQAVATVTKILGTNHLSKVAYGTEAGIFKNGLRVPTIICGPGSIEVAHKPNEYVAQSQLDACDDFLQKLCAVYAD